MKEKILAQLKTKYKGAPAKLLGQMAEKLAAKVTKEDEIEGAVGELENQTIPFSEVIAQLQEEGDSRVAAAKKKWEKENPSGKQEGKTDDEPEGGNKGKGADDAPAWAKSLIESNKTLSEKLAALEKEKSQAAMADKIKSHEKLKDVPAKFFKGRPLPEKEEDIDNWANEVATDWTEFAQENTNHAFASSSKPFASAGSGNGISSAMQARIDARTKPAETAGAIVGKKL